MTAAQPAWVACKWFVAAKLVLSPVFFLAAASCLQAAPPSVYNLVWSDEFNGTSLDTNKWNYYEPHKRRDAWNIPRAVSVTNGCLTITTFSRDGKYFTSMLDTRGKFERTRGYWEARIEYDDSPGMWSAFWMDLRAWAASLATPRRRALKLTSASTAPLMREERASRQSATHVALGRLWKISQERRAFDPRSGPWLGFPYLRL